MIDIFKGVNTAEMSISILVLGFLVSPALAAYKKPHIVMVVADDLGWDDVSFHGSRQIPTPTIDRLAKEGVMLNNYYVSSLSTPTRTAFMTGKYASRLGVQHDAFHNQQPVGLPLSEKLLPNHLRELGYTAHGVGKWHLGFFAKEYTPTYRGFDSFYGFWTNTEDYYSHVSYDNGYGLDLRRDMQLVYNESGTYSTELFTREAKHIIDHHNDDEKPLFLYVAHQAVHVGNGDDPLQAPEKYIKKFAGIEDLSRRKFAGMVSTLDDSLKTITDALTNKKMMDNTIIIFTTDNGGAAGGYDNSAGSNYPLRGSKHTLWEGGVRGIGFVYSPLLHNNGRVCDELIHATDWLPTIYAAGGGNVVSLGKLDGYNVWKTLSEGTSSPRFEILHGIDNLGPLAGALRVGDYKLILNQDDSNYGDWYPRPGTSIPLGTNERKRRSVEEGTTVDCTIQEQHPLLFTHAPVCKPREKPCLFNIRWDPCEYHNIAEIMPNTMKVMLERFYHFANSSAKPVYPDADNSSKPDFHDGTWTFWRDSPVIPGTNTDYNYPDPMADLKLSDDGGSSSPVFVSDNEKIFKEKAKPLQHVNRNKTTLPGEHPTKNIHAPTQHHHDQQVPVSHHHHQPPPVPIHHNITHHTVSKPSPPIVQHIHPNVVIDGITNVLNADSQPAPVINGISNILNTGNFVQPTEAPAPFIPEPTKPNPKFVPTDSFIIPTGPPVIDIQNLLLDTAGSGVSPTGPPIPDYMLPTMPVEPANIMEPPTLGEVISGKPIEEKSKHKSLGEKAHSKAMKIDMPQVYDVIDETDNPGENPSEMSNVYDIIDLNTVKTKATSKHPIEGSGTKPSLVPPPPPPPAPPARVSPLSTFFKPSHVVPQAPKVTQTHPPASHSFEGDIIMDGHKFHVKGTESGDFNFVNDALDQTRDQKSHVTEKPKNTKLNKQAGNENNDDAENYSEVTDVIDDTLEEMEKPVINLATAKKPGHHGLKSSSLRKTKARTNQDETKHYNKNTKSATHHKHAGQTGHKTGSVPHIHKNGTSISKKNDTDCEKPTQLQTSDNAVVVSSVVIVVIASAMVVGVALVAMIAVVARHIKKSRNEDGSGSS